MLGLICNSLTTINVLHYYSTQDPPNINDEDEIDHHLDHGGVHVDIDCKFPNDPQLLDIVGQVTTHAGKHTIDSLLDL